MSKTYRGSEWLVLFSSGATVPANSEREANEIAIRYLARGIQAEAVRV